MHITVGSNYIISSFPLGYLTYLNINLHFTFNVAVFIIILPSHSIPVKSEGGIHYCLSAILASLYACFQLNLPMSTSQ